MQVSRLLNHCVMGAACLALLAACDMLSGDSDNKTHPRRHTATRATPVVKPELAAPASHKTCTETFKLQVADPRYTKCIASLRELEAK